MSSEPLPLSLRKLLSLPPSERMRLKSSLSRLLATKSLHEFVKQAWPIVDPAMPYRDSWHIGAICEHLEAVAKGQITRLLINIPPGHAKSLLVSVFWPAWVWTWKPTWQAIFASYAHDLAVRDSVRCRTLIENDWYKQNFGLNWSLRDDSNRKQDFYNTVGGRRLSMSVDGKATGERGNCVVVDDPLNAKDALSKLARENVIYWWDKVMSSRLNDMEKDSRVIIMQRLHQEDLSGHVLEQGGYEHLCLPSEFDSKRRSVTSIWSDPRKEEGELLFPALFPRNVLDQAKKDLGSDGYAGQHDQMPTSAEGGMFKRSWWRYWKKSDQEGTARVLPVLERIIISLDAAFKAGEMNDYVVFTVWGVCKADRFLLDMVRGKFTFTQTVQHMRDLCKKWPMARKKLVEDKANGSAVIDILKSEISGMVPINPEGGKESRAAAIQPQIESGNVYLPAGAPWLDEWLDEFASFPKGRHDDMVDSCSQALLDLSPRSDAFRALGMTNF